MMYWDTSLFYYNHYIGRIRGGHYYYSKSVDIIDIEIQYDKTKDKDELK